MKINRCQLTFVLGMIAAFCIAGAVEALNIEQQYDLILPWWLFVVVAILATAAAGYVSSIGGE